MFDYVLEKLAGDIVTSIRDVPLSSSPSTKDLYDRIRVRLVTDFAPSVWQRAENIITPTWATDAPVR